MCKDCRNIHLKDFQLLLEQNVILDEYKCKAYFSDFYHKTFRKLHIFFSYKNYEWLCFGNSQKNTLKSVLATVTICTKLLGVMNYFMRRCKAGREKKKSNQRGSAETLNYNKGKGKM